MQIFTQISLILAVAATLSVLARLLKQPAILAYVITGFLCATYFLQVGNLGANDTFSTFSDLGIAILLFIVGINLSPKAIKTVGKNAFLAGAGQMIFTTFAGYLLAKFLGFDPIPAIIMAVAFSFSSTIIVLKLLGDLGDLEKLHSRLAIGILLLQDLTASICLIFLTTLDKSSQGSLLIATLFLKGVVVSLLVWLISTKFLGRLSKFFAQSQENLFIFSIAWGFGISSLFAEIGFSKEIGALVAGVALSTLPYSAEISSKLRPLRDFFVILFFIALGSKIESAEVLQFLPQIIILSVFVVLVKPVITALNLRLLGYHRKIAFKTGVSLAQISEFSLVLVLLAQKLNFVDGNIVQITTLVCVVTITLSSYLIKFSNGIYALLNKIIKPTKWSDKDALEADKPAYDVILFGCNRVGWDFVKAFKNLGMGFLAVDFNPETLEELKKKNINCIYGDAEDVEFLDELNVAQARMVISTIPDYETNILLLGEIRKTNQESAVVLISYNVDDALTFYKKGATYVILPHFISAQHAMQLLEEFGINHKSFENEKNNHILYLNERKNMGHAHPPH
ncbi:MAG: cation:proton antiporter [Patescibacteria group bacterium]